MNPNQITKKDLHAVGMTLGDMAEELGVTYMTVWNALKRETKTTGRIRAVLQKKRKNLGMKS